MNYTYWLLIVVAVIVFANMATWLIRKNSAKETFTGNADSSGQTGVLSVHSASSRSTIAPGNLEATVRTLFASGRKIEAIKRVREQTGLGLKEAKELVEAMERGTPVSIHAGASLLAFHGDLDGEAQKLVAAGHKLEAIKLVREQKNLGLKEAKDYVDRL